MVQLKLNSVFVVFAIISVVGHLSGDDEFGSITGAVAMVALMLKWVYEGLRKNDENI